MLMTEITRKEFDARHNELVTRVSRIEEKLDVMSEHLSSANITTSVLVWKFVASLLGGIILGLLPYIVHISGVLK